LKIFIMFKLFKKSKKSSARLSILKTAHGDIRTPFFMPVATRGAVKHISAEEVGKLGAQILLSNTYHLMLRPGVEVIKKAARFRVSAGGHRRAAATLQRGEGGLHKFMDWRGAILTDSGGFQIFSLAGKKNKNGRNLVKITGGGVRFKSHLDGREYYLTPERSLRIQADLGVDIAVCLDECVALPASKAYVAGSVALTSAWAKKAKNYHRKLKGRKPLLFGVVQGGLDKDLRLRSLAELTAIGFDGYNIGGLSVGESTTEMYAVLDYLCPAMPADRPRYLMGVGYPEQIVEAVKRGVDMFDCVIPTREGRHGRMFRWTKAAKVPGLKSFDRGSKNARITNGERITDNFYETNNINRAKFARDFSPININSKLPELRNLSKAYLHHLFKAGEPLGPRLASLNNLEFYLDLMGAIRQSIRENLL